MKTFNFSAGPGVLPSEVLKKVQTDLLNYNNTGCSVMELSHRSDAFESILAKAESDFRSLLSIPSNYSVLFMQGGASTQFSSVVYNLVTDVKKPCDYIVTGGWSEKASAEAKRLGANVNIALNTKSSNHNGDIALKNLKLSDDPTYIYYCDNETVHGVEFPSTFIDELPYQRIPVVCDMSSNFASRKVDVAKYGIIFGGAQKNIGPAGLTLVIIRNDLIGLFDNCFLKGPLMLNYKTYADNRSMYNTPPTFPIYVAGLVFDWALALGGLEKIAELNNVKSKLLYDALQEYPNIYKFAVVNPDFWSRMNVPFSVIKDGIPAKDLEKQFIAGAEKLGMICLAGHRSVGGMRASLYNALPLEGVDLLVSYIHSFAKQLK
ncbi:pyridoxal phosphate-dependent transferase [Globomyces pollinis-pini]|nr:pyridoxal phosphate-dependent transferase [Globomyces pollinis-pini]